MKKQYPVGRKPVVFGTPEYELRKKRLDWDNLMGREMVRIMRRFAPNDATALRVYELFQEEVVQEARRKDPSSLYYFENKLCILRVVEREIQHRLGSRSDRAGWVRNRVKEIEAESALPVTVTSSG